MSFLDGGNERCNPFMVSLIDVRSSEVLKAACEKSLCGEVTLILQYQGAHDTGMPFLNGDE